MDLGIEGKVAAVGGASTGLGKAVAWALAREGARVAICARGKEQLEHTGLALNRASGREIFAYPCDLATESGPKEFVEATVKELGKLDILVCNAGGPPATISSKTPPDAWSEALELSLLSTIRMSQAALPYMRRNGWGRIICMTSVSVKSPLPGMILAGGEARPGLGQYRRRSDDRTRRQHPGRPHGRPEGAGRPGSVSRLGVCRVHHRHHHPNRRRLRARAALAGSHSGDDV
jgi:3-oxoacyl-[acyl-carrier protein] reductase